MPIFHVGGWLGSQRLTMGSKGQFGLAKTQRVWFCKIFGLVQRWTLSRGPFCSLGDIWQHGQPFVVTLGNGSAQYGTRGWRPEILLNMDSPSL